MKPTNKSNNGGVGNGINDVTMTVTEADDDVIDATHTVTNGGNTVKKKKRSTCSIMQCYANKKNKKRLSCNDE